jgi:hypothetical protein
LTSDADRDQASIDREELTGKQFAAKLRFNLKTAVEILRMFRNRAFCGA